MIRKFLLASVGALALTGSAALAADLPLRAPPPVYVPPAPIFTWTGSISALRSAMPGAAAAATSPDLIRLPMLLSRPTLAAVIRMG